MSRKMFVLIPLVFALGCHCCHGKRRCERVDNSCQCAQEEVACSSPAAAPAAAPQQAQFVAPQQPMMMPQPQYMAAATAYGAPPQQVTGALGLGVVRVPLIIPKLYAVPKPAAPQMVAIQQAPMMMPQMMMAPQGMAMAPQSAPACPSTDAANSALLMALLQQQQQQQQNAPLSRPAASPEEADLEARAMKLEQKLDALTDALEKGR